jgi:tRNA threonylcarbamoyladenosine biosynthesis protein TsaB
MNLLAVETSTELCSVALVRGTDLFAEEVLAENRHSDLLVPMLKRILAQGGLAPRDLDAFAFGQGPGSFTGLRIACGVVQGMAYAAGRPVIAVPTLLALAEQSGEGRVVAALDARMGEAYLAAYARNADDWDEVISPQLCAPQELPPLPGARWTATGSGFDRHAWLRDAYRESVERRVEGDLPRAGAIARIAARRFARGAGVPAELAAPLYLRDKVALTSEERRVRR